MRTKRSLEVYLKNKEEGFTLIELLAVIVILAIIALIATPIVLNMINSARKKAAESGAYGFIDAVEYNNGFAQTEQEGYTEINGENLDVTSQTFSDLKVKGKKPTSGTITITDGKVVSATLCVEGYTVTYNGREVTKVDKGCDSNLSTPQSNDVVTNYTNAEVDADLNIYPLGDDTNKYQVVGVYNSSTNTITVTKNGQSSNGVVNMRGEFGGNKTLIEGLKVVLEEGILEIPQSSFEDVTCSSVTIPSSTTTIAERAFYRNNGLTQIKVDSSNPNYKDVNGVLFTKNGKTLLAYPFGNGLTSYSIPESTERIGLTALAGSLVDPYTLDELKIPDSVTEFEEFSFWGTNVTNLYINSDTKSILDNVNTGLYYSNVLPYSSN